MNANKIDIFISYSKDDKDIAFEICSYLENKNINCWIASRDVRAGKNYGGEINFAIKNCNALLLVLSTSANKSDHVANEIDLAFNNQKIILPFKIQEFILSDTLEYYLCKFHFIDATKNYEDQIATLCSTYQQILKTKEYAAKVIKGKLESPGSDEINNEEIVLRIGGISDIVKWGWDGIKLLDEFIRIDYETLEQLDSESEGHSKQWAPIFMHHPDTWRMIIANDNIIAGYWHLVPLFDDAYQIALSGKLLDSEITLDKVSCFELGGVFKVYICQICLLPEYRTTATIILLINSLFDVLEILAKNDIWISDICANAYTLAGHSLCKTFRMSYKCQHEHSGSIYAASISTILNCSLGSKRIELRTLYKNQGLL